MRSVFLVAAILVVTVVLAVGASPLWVEVPLRMFFGAASLVGLMGTARKADL